MDSLRAPQIPSLETIVTSVLSEFNPVRVFQWRWSPVSPIISSYKSVQFYQIISHESNQSTQPTHPDFTPLKSNTRLAVKGWMGGYHVMNMPMGSELYDLTIVDEEFQPDKNGRDPWRTQARQAFLQCIYNARSLTKHGGVVVVRAARGWDQKSRREIWRWSYMHQFGDVWVVSEEGQAVDRATRAVQTSSKILQPITQGE